MEFTKEEKKLLINALYIAKQKEETLQKTARELKDMEMVEETLENILAINQLLVKFGEKE